MNVDVKVTGVADLQRRITLIEEAARTNKLAFRGISDAARILSVEMRSSAPVRKGRVQRLKLRQLLKKFTRKGYATAQNKAKASKAATVIQRKWRSVKRTKGIAPGQRAEIKPGQLRRSIHSRVIRDRKMGFISAKAGMNVGLKRRDSRRAPHAHLVGLGTAIRETKLKQNRGIMPQNVFARDAAQRAAPRALSALESRIREDIDRTIMQLGGAR